MTALEPIQSDGQTGVGAGMSRVAVLLLQGVVARDSGPMDFQAVERHQTALRDYFSVVGLDLVIDTSEGFAFVRSRDRDPDADSADPLGSIPRLAVRRQLSFPVSLLVALLRKRLAEFDARGGDTRLVLSRNDIVELVRVFLPDRSDEAKLMANLDTYVNKVIDLGFLRRLGASATSAGSVGSAGFEVRRTIKAFVDAQWLAEFDAKLARYRAALGRDLGLEGDNDE